MPWISKVGEKRLPVNDLPLAVFEEAEAESGIPWYRLMDAPLSTAKGGRVFAELIAKHLGLEQAPPETASELLELFEWSDTDEVPTLYNDAGIPDPKAPEGEPSTTGKPGEPSTSDGPPT